MPITFTGGMGEVSYDYAAKKTDVVINLGALFVKVVVSKS
jgi:hypothetical protein